MKILVLKSIFILTFFMSAVNKKNSNLELETLITTYEGYNDIGYSFTYYDELLEDEVEFIFEKISKELLKKYDLNDDKYVGKKFEITVEYVYDDKEEIDVPILKSIKKEEI